MANFNTDIETKFLTAMGDVGLEFLGPVSADGRLHRFHVQGDRAGSKNGWYVLHEDEVPVGVFGSWKLGVTHTWRHESYTRLDSDARQRCHDRMAKAQHTAERMRKELAKAAAIRAQGIWVKASPTPLDHPYLLTKQIRPFDVRVYKNSLVIPVYDSSGCLATLQFINGEGTKRFLKDGAKRGHYFAMGEPGPLIYVVEGFATAVSSTMK